MSLFRLDASIRTEGSHSRELADIVEAEWRAAHPDYVSAYDLARRTPHGHEACAAAEGPEPARMR